MVENLYFESVYNVGITNCVVTGYSIIHRGKCIYYVNYIFVVIMVCSRQSLYNSKYCIKYNVQIFCFLTFRWKFRSRTKDFLIKSFKTTVRMHAPTFQ